MLNRRQKLGPFAAMIAASLASKASANGFRLLDQDAFATARGEAFVATADNASAVYYNPAGITQLDGNNLRSGIYGIYVNADYRPTPAMPAARTMTLIISPRFPRSSSRTPSRNCR